MSIKFLTNKSIFDSIPFIFLACLLSVPFFLIIRTQPNSGYIIESITVILVLLLAISLICLGKIPSSIPRASYIFIIFAFVWFLQTLIMPLKFVGQSYFAIGIFIVMAILAFSIRALIEHFGRENVLVFVATCLMFAALLQTLIAVLQYLNIAADLNKLINEQVAVGRVFLTPGRENIYGQLAQRNHFAHFLMWGVASTIYLSAVKKIHMALAVSILFFFGFFLGLSGSRTVLLYIILFVVLSVFWFFRERHSSEIKRVLFLVFIMTAILLLFQSQTIMSLLGPSNTGLSRVIAEGGSGGRRFYEWHKAWLIFMESPFFGTGWTQYSISAFELDKLPYFNSEPKESGLFTHSHNILFQLLAEMGVVGLFAVLVGFLGLVFPYIREKASIFSLFPLMLISVSFAHSMLEYPLWYIYFLAPFVLFLSVQDVNAEIHKDSLVSGTQRLALGGGVLMLAVFLLIKTSMLLSTYLDLRNAYFLKNDSAHIEKVQSIIQPIIKKNSFLAYEATYTLEMAHAVIYDKKSSNVIKKDYWDINERLVEYRPFSYPVLRRSIYLNDQGKTVEASNLLDKTNRYYVPLVPKFLSMLNVKREKNAELYEQTYQTCKRLKQDIYPSFVCELEKTKDDVKKTIASKGG